MSSYREVLVDLFAGSLGGVAGIVVGHPLDVIKTRLQSTSSPYQGLSISYTVRHTLQKEGPGAFLKGILPPIIGAAPYQAVCFASYQWAYNFQTKTLPPAYRFEDDGNSVLVAGLFSGAATTLVTTPMDLIKIALQLETGKSVNKHSSRSNGSSIARCRSVINDIWKKNGSLGFFRGMGACLVRDVPTTGVYFLTYDFIKAYLHNLYPPDVISKKDHNFENEREITNQQEFSSELAIEPPPRQRPGFFEMLSGGIAGSTAWAMAVPSDNLKTRIQSPQASRGEGSRFVTGHVAAKHYHHNQQRSLFQTARYIIKTEGIGALFQGGTPIVLRAFPANAVTFYVYEWMRIGMTNLVEERDCGIEI
eukprot:g322.t1